MGVDKLSIPEVVRLPEKPEVKPVELEASKSALIIVDMQNDFVDERGRLFVSSSRGTIEPIRRVLEGARSAGATVIYTQDWHTRDDPEFRTSARRFNSSSLIFSSALIPFRLFFILSIHGR